MVETLHISVHNIMHLHFQKNIIQTKPHSFFFFFAYVRHLGKLTCYDSSTNVFQFNYGSLWKQNLY